LPERISGPGDLLIENDRIVQISESPAAAPKADEIIDLDGATLFPGFIDIHIHGAAGVDTMAASGADLERAARFLATQGVTGWLPTLVPASTDNYRQAIAAIDAVITAQSGGSARVLGVHYEGPFVNALQCGALHADCFRAFSQGNELDDLPRLRSANVSHLMTLAPEIAGGIELVRALRQHGWIAAIGHTRADFAVLDKALTAGARHLTHFMNAMAPLHHRSPGPVAWGLSRDEVTCDLIADGIHLNPDMLRLLLKLKGAGRLSLISDAIAAAGQGDGDYEIWGETITVKDGRTSNSRGSIAGSVITMLDAVRLMLSLEAPENEVALMSSGNPAKLLGIQDDCGSIEVGKRADLVALDHERTVHSSPTL
jgi:N-acetylglucosamine-6-phosphate deacetylase